MNPSEPLDLLGLEELPTECISMIKSNLDNRSLLRFSLSCSQINEVPLSKNEISARKCGYHWIVIDATQRHPRPTQYHDEAIKGIFRKGIFKCGHIRCFRYLENLASSDKRFLEILRNRDDTFFSDAATCDRIELFNLLLSVIPTMSNDPMILLQMAESRDNRALRMAAMNGHLEIVEKLVPILKTKDGSLIRAIRCQNSWAFRLAAYYGHFEVVKLLVSIVSALGGREMVIEMIQEYNNEALRFSSEKGYVEIVKLLLASGLTRAHIHEDDYDQALDWARYNRRFEVIPLLVGLAEGNN